MEKVVRLLQEKGSFECGMGELCCGPTSFVCLLSGERPEKLNKTKENEVSKLQQLPILLLPNELFLSQDFYKIKRKERFFYSSEEY